MLNKLLIAFVLALAPLKASAQSAITLPIAANAVADIGNGPIKVRMVAGNASIFTSQGSGLGSTSGSSTALTLTATPATPPIVGALISGAGITSGTTVTAFNGTTGITLSAAMTVAGGTAVAWGASCPSTPPSNVIQASAQADYYIMYTQARVCAVSPGGPVNTLLVEPIFYDQTTSNAGGSGNVTGPGSSTVGHLSTWNNTAGTLLADTSAIAGRYIFSPVLQDGGAGLNDIGIYVTPSVGASTTNGSFLTPFNILWAGPGSVPIPAGTKGSLDGYECNLSTNQTLADTSAAQGNHCFGATMQLHGGSEAQGVAITSTIDMVPATYYSANFNINKNVAGGSVAFIELSSTGSQPVDFAFQAIGNYASLINSSFFNVNGASGFTAIGPNSAGDNVPLSLVAQANAASVSAVTSSINNLHIAGADASANQMVFDSFGGPNVFLARRADGTAASRTGLVANDVIGGLNAFGWTSAGAYSGGNAAAVNLLATETWSGTANGSELKVRTTKNTTNTIADAMIVDGYGHLQVGSIAPTSVSTCGTGSIVANSTDASGQVIATGATACTLNFGNAYASAPNCTVTDNSNAVALKAVPATGSLTVSGLTSGDTFTYICFAKVGG